MLQKLFIITVKKRVNNQMVEYDLFNRESNNKYVKKKKQYRGHNRSDRIAI